MQGQYHLVCRIFQVIIIIESGIVYYIDLSNPTAASLADRISGWVAGSFFVIFNIAYAIVLAFKVSLPDRLYDSVNFVSKTNF